MLIKYTPYFLILIYRIVLSIVMCTAHIFSNFKFLLQKSLLTHTKSNDKMFTLYCYCINAVIINQFFLIFHIFTIHPKRQTVTIKTWFCYIKLNVNCFILQKQLWGKKIYFQPTMGPILTRRFRLLDRTLPYRYYTVLYIMLTSTNVTTNINLFCTPILDTKVSAPHPVEKLII